MKEHNLITGNIVNAAFQIHKQLGPGLLESVYEAVLFHELKTRGFHVERQKPISISFNEMNFDEGFLADLEVEKKVIVELKSIEKVIPTHKKQLLTYIKLSGLRVGLLINFSEYLIKNGVTRIVNGL
jgi:GxxExxY protein